MGIIKIRHQGQRKHKDPPHWSLTLENKFVEEERLIMATDHSHELDDFEISDPGCEYALVNDQICNVPYELYELSNLNEILSLETWNSSLTEDERFYLAAYLPDMDQETFSLTMLELLRAANLFFGSPLEIFFHRLKGGFYSLKVSHYRERLEFLYVRRYFHSLRSYHERLCQKIVDMRKAWSNCRPNTCIEERVQILNNRKYRKPVFLVDLNAFPTDEEFSSKAENKVMRLPQVKKPRHINEVESTHVPAMDWNGMGLNSRKKAKGVLKIKPLTMNVASKQIGLQLHTESQELYRRPPKGVLKIKRKGYPNSLVERPKVISVLPEKNSNSVFDVCQTKISSSCFASQLQEENLYSKLKTDFTNGRKSEDALIIGSELFDNARSFLRKNTVNSMKIYSNDTSDFGGFFDSQKTEVLSPGSLGLYLSASDNYGRKIMPVHTNFTKAVSRKSTLVMDDCQIFPNYPDHSEHWHREKNGDDVGRSSMFPLTYKRKKYVTKLSSVQNLKQPSMVDNMEPAASTAADFHQVDKAKSIKIIVKGWNEFNS
ncbi:hypothetical protein KFK09_014944 [Dendrobium nobile]|uniref:DEUBAD domain-containing protein n=1 Tax=Dendrobium nobile TaxID=94219 RepID=A0A8T3B352_DENNO|nr:hypothetical protein KFK09_014944 [Dendrobium nobile]